jgi:hypothetical protein
MISFLCHSHRKINPKSGMDFFNEEDILNINDVELNLEYIYKKIENQSELNEFLDLKLGSICDKNESDNYFGVGEPEKCVDIICKYMNQNGTTIILKNIYDGLGINLENIKLAKKCDFGMYKHLVYWWPACKKYIKITNDEQKELCKQIEKILREIGLIVNIDGIEYYKYNS